MVQQSLIQRVALVIREYRRICMDFSVGTSFCQVIALLYSIVVLDLSGSLVILSAWFLNLYSGDLFFIAHWECGCIILIITMKIIFIQMMIACFFVTHFSHTAITLKYCTFNWMLSCPQSLCIRNSLDFTIFVILLCLLNQITPGLYFIWTLASLFMLLLYSKVFCKVLYLCNQSFKLQIGH